MLACSLAQHGAYRVILTPDDNYDHRNHFHIETYRDRAGPLLSARERRQHVARTAPLPRR